MKLFKIFSLTALLAVSTITNATLMTEDNYITLDHGNGISIDWAWASNYNVQYYTEFFAPVNELYAASYVDGWREASDDEIAFFEDNNINSTHFQYSGGYKNAVSFFNSNADLGVSPFDLDRGDVSFKHRAGSSMDNIFSYDPIGVFDTFYVRDSLTSLPPGSGPTPIPEPWSLVIFVTGLLALQSKLSKKSV